MSVALRLEADTRHINWAILVALISGNEVKSSVKDAATSDRIPQLQ